VLALAMRDAAVELSAKWKKRGVDLGLGIGVAQGFATVGAIGFEGRIDYGAIGTVTNLAAACASTRRPARSSCRSVSSPSERHVLDPRPGRAHAARLCAADARLPPGRPPAGCAGRRVLVALHPRFHPARRRAACSLSSADPGPGLGLVLLEG
jgi:hypothetical protein